MGSNTWRRWHNKLVRRGTKTSGTGVKGVWVCVCVCVCVPTRCLSKLTAKTNRTRRNTIHQITSEKSDWLLMTQVRFAYAGKRWGEGEGTNEDEWNAEAKIWKWNVWTVCPLPAWDTHCPHETHIAHARHTAHVRHMLPTWHILPTRDTYCPCETHLWETHTTHVRHILPMWYTHLWETHTAHVRHILPTWNTAHVRNILPMWDTHLWETHTAHVRHILPMWYTHLWETHTAHVRHILPMWDRRTNPRARSAVLPPVQERRDKQPRLQKDSGDPKRIGADRHSLQHRQLHIWYHWRELPQVWFLSRQTRVCRNKHTFVATKDVFCHDKSFVATSILFSRQKTCLSWQTCICRDKSTEMIPVAAFANGNLGTILERWRRRRRVAGKACKAIFWPAPSC